jgi:Protein of unknown function (DUF2844)
MKIFSYVRNRVSSFGLLGLAVVLIAGLSLPAFATLGGDEASIEVDRAQMKATLTTTRTNTYTMEEIQHPNGTVVHEYLSPAGKVFAITWRGPFIPDMSQLLGTYLPQYSEGVKEHHAAGPGRRPLNIQKPTLVVQTSGHMRSFAGRAYDPTLLPQGVTASDIR